VGEGACASIILCGVTLGPIFFINSRIVEIVSFSVGLRHNSAFEQKIAALPGNVFTDKHKMLEIPFRFAKCCKERNITPTNGDDK